MESRHATPPQVRGKILHVRDYPASSPAGLFFDHGRAILAVDTLLEGWSLLLFLEAFVLGVVVAAPLGPVGATVVRTGLLRGFGPALAIGVGAAVVDGVYFVAAAAGASQAFRTAWLGVPLWLGGTAFLAYLGFSGLAGGTRTPQETASIPYSVPLAFGHGLLITLLNPLTIASWLAVAGSLAVSAEKMWALLAAGAFISVGSAAWFAFLSAGVAWSRRLAGGALRRWSAAAASILILAFAARFLVQGLSEYVL
jgi:threonine/homoserine/homoserine lactone efflux protein